MGKNYLLKGDFWDGFRSVARWFIPPAVLVLAYSLWQWAGA